MAASLGPVDFHECQGLPGAVKHQHDRMRVRALPDPLVGAQDDATDPDEGPRRACACGERRCALVDRFADRRLRRIVPAEKTQGLSTTRGW